MENTLLSPDQEISAEKRVALAQRLLKVHGDSAAFLGTVSIIVSGIGSGLVFADDGQLPHFFDIDVLKTAAMQTMAIAKKLRDEFGSDAEQLPTNYSDPKRLSKLREITATHIGIDDERTRALLTGVVASSPDQKTNLMFDVTLQHLRQLETLARVARTLGYAGDRIHLIWMVADFATARAHLTGHEPLSPEVLKNIHRGVAATMHDVCTMEKEVRKYIDGGVLIHVNSPDSGGAETVVLKKAGKDPVSFAGIDIEFRKKVSLRVPSGALW
ncbi:hypothetical protein [Rhizobium leguminosarum]|uniref:hypothetical protein n=1 Tax=Rhizobium leguminosarum TaxID=384 RepID=UPI003F9C9E45